MRILFLTSRFPYPPTKGDQLRAFHQLRVLARDHEIILVSFHDDNVSPKTRDIMSSYCRRMEVVHLSPRRSQLSMCLALPSRTPFQVAYYRSGAMTRLLRRLVQEERIDLILLQLVRMVPYTEVLQDIPRVLDMVDALSLNMRRRATREPFPVSLLLAWESSRMRAWERRSIGLVDEVVITSPVDRDALDRPVAHVIPNGVDLAYFSLPDPGKKTDKRVVFTGNMGYFPNREAARFFLREVWPGVLSEVPDARFQLVGDRPSRDIRRLCRASKSVEVTGYVEDLRAYLWGASVAVSPLRSGSGMPNKVLEAMATGTPLVSTSRALAAISAEDGRHLLLADDPRKFIECVVDLLRFPERGMRLASEARRLVEERYSWEVSVARLEAVLERVRESGVPRRFPDSS